MLMFSTPPARPKSYCPDCARGVSGALCRVLCVRCVYMSLCVVTYANGAGNVGHGLEAGRALAVDGHHRHLLRQAAEDTGDAHLQKDA